MGASSASGLPGILVVSLGYIFLFIGGCIVYLVEKLSSRGGNAFVLFHGMQAMLFAAAYFCCVLVPLIVLDAVLSNTVGVGGFITPIAFLIYLCSICLIIFQSLKFHRDSSVGWKIPFIGNLAAKYSHTA
ncbi:hypothetical protein QOT17_008487 [Balamuthia mandrillaris]